MTARARRTVNALGLCLSILLGFSGPGSAADRSATGLLPDVPAWIPLSELCAWATSVDASPLQMNRILLLHEAYRDEFTGVLELHSTAYLDRWCLVESMPALAITPRDVSRYRADRRTILESLHSSDRELFDRLRDILIPSQESDLRRLEWTRELRVAASDPHVRSWFAGGDPVDVAGLFERLSGTGPMSEDAIDVCETYRTRLQSILASLGEAAFHARERSAQLVADADAPPNGTSQRRRQAYANRLLMGIWKEACADSEDLVASYLDLNSSAVKQLARACDGETSWRLHREYARSEFGPACAPFLESATLLERARDTCPDGVSPAELQGEMERHRRLAREQMLAARDDLHLATVSSLPGTTFLRAGVPIAQARIETLTTEKLGPQVEQARRFIEQRCGERGLAEAQQAWRRTYLQLAGLSSRPLGGDGVSPRNAPRQLVRTEQSIAFAMPWPVKRLRLAEILDALDLDDDISRTLATRYQEFCDRQNAFVTQRIDEVALHVGLVTTRDPDGSFHRDFVGPDRVADLFQRLNVENSDYARSWKTFVPEIVGALPTEKQPAVRALLELDHDVQRLMRWRSWDAGNLVPPESFLDFVGPVMHGCGRLDPASGLESVVESMGDLARAVRACDESIMSYVHAYEMQFAFEKMPILVQADGPGDEEGLREERAARDERDQGREAWTRHVDEREEVLVRRLDELAGSVKRLAALRDPEGKEDCVHRAIEAYHANIVRDEIEWRDAMRSRASAIADRSDVIRPDESGSLLLRLMSLIDSIYQGRVEFRVDRAFRTSLDDEQTTRIEDGRTDCLNLLARDVETELTLLEGQLQTTP